MRRIQSAVFIVLCLAVSFFLRAETPESCVPDFAVAKLSIAQMGVFLEKNGAVANFIIPNASPITKIILANYLYRLPIDESLNFEGPVQIYLIPPLKLSTGQDLATILPVADPEKVKKNVASLYNDPPEKNGVFECSLPQPIPDPDKPLFIKVTKDKAYLAPSMDVLAQM